MNKKTKEEQLAPLEAAHARGSGPLTTLLNDARTPEERAAAIHDATYELLREGVEALEALLASLRMEARLGEEAADREPAARPEPSSSGHVGFDLGADVCPAVSSAGRTLVQTATAVKVTYACVGPVRGGCRHRHTSIRTAYKCLTRDVKTCLRSGGYSDRCIVRTDGCEFTQEEVDEIERWAARIS